MMSLRKVPPARRNVSTSAARSAISSLDAVPAARLRLSAIGHRSRGTATAADAAEQEEQVALDHAGEAQRRVAGDREPKKSGVEGDRRLDVTHDVAHTHPGHDHSFPE
jgi:hypothetical protein